MDKKDAIQCEKCGQKFTLMSNFKRHVRHNKICGISKSQFKCVNCHKDFSLKSTMKAHYERCTAEDPYRFMCPNCPKLFTFKSSLNKHLRGRCRFAIKKEEKPFKCEFCIAEFFNSNALDKHLSLGKCLTKNSIDHFICHYCGNNFTLKNSLNKHLNGRCKVLSPKDTAKSTVEFLVKEEDDSTTTYEIIDDGDFIEECTDYEDYETENYSECREGESIISD